MYNKYSSSQNYYFTKDLNEILSNQRTKSVIKYKDQIQYDEEEEYLKRSYKLKEYPHKIKLLTEYYKFHQDIPRMFCLPETVILNNFHDKKRRIEYFRIAKLIESENQKNPNKPPKGIVGDKPGMKTNESETIDHDQKQQNQVEDKILKDLSSFIKKDQNKNYNAIQIIDQQQQNQQNNLINLQNGHQNSQLDNENSVTIWYLNNKLEEAIQNNDFKTQNKNQTQYNQNQKDQLDLSSLSYQTVNKSYHFSNNVNMQNNYQKQQLQKKEKNQNFHDLDNFLKFLHQMKEKQGNDSCIVELSHLEISQNQSQKRYQPKLKQEIEIQLQKQKPQNQNFKKIQKNEQQIQQKLQNHQQQLKKNDKSNNNGQLKSDNKQQQNKQSQPILQESSLLFKQQTKQNFKNAISQQPSVQQQTQKQQLNKKPHISNLKLEDIDYNQIYKQSENENQQKGSSYLLQTAKNIQTKEAFMDFIYSSRNHNNKNTVIDKKQEIENLQNKNQYINSQNINQQKGFLNMDNNNNLDAKTIGNQIQQQINQLNQQGQSIQLKNQIDKQLVTNRQGQNLVKDNQEKARNLTLKLAKNSLSKLKISPRSQLDGIKLESQYFDNSIGKSVPQTQMHQKTSSLGQFQINLSKKKSINNSKKSSNNSSKNINPKLRSQNFSSQNQNLLTEKQLKLEKEQQDFIISPGKKSQKKNLNIQKNQNNTNRPKSGIQNHQIKDLSLKSSNHGNSTKINFFNQDNQFNNNNIYKNEQKILKYLENISPDVKQMNNYINTGSFTHRELGRDNQSQNNNSGIYQKTLQNSSTKHQYQKQQQQFNLNNNEFFQIKNTDKNQYDNQNLGQQFSKESKLEYNRLASSSEFQKQQLQHKRTQSQIDNKLLTQKFMQQDIQSFKNNQANKQQLIQNQSQLKSSKPSQNLQLQQKNQQTGNNFLQNQPSSTTQNFSLSQKIITAQKQISRNSSHEQGLKNKKQLNIARKNNPQISLQSQKINKSNQIYQNDIDKNQIPSELQQINEYNLNSKNISQQQLMYAEAKKLYNNQSAKNRNSMHDFQIQKLQQQQKNQNHKHTKSEKFDNYSTIQQKISTQNSPRIIINLNQQVPNNNTNSDNLNKTNTISQKQKQFIEQSNNNNDILLQKKFENFNFTHNIAKKNLQNNGNSNNNVKNNNLTPQQQQQKKLNLNQIQEQIKSQFQQKLSPDNKITSKQQTKTNFFDKKQKGQTERSSIKIQHNNQNQINNPDQILNSSGNLSNKSRAVLGTSDFLYQKYIQKRKVLDYQRIKVNTMIGVSVMSPYLCLWFMKLQPNLLKLLSLNQGSTGFLIGSVVTDAMIFFPVAQCLYHFTFEQIYNNYLKQQSHNWLQVEKCEHSLSNYWKVWVPVCGFYYWFVPGMFRPLMANVSMSSWNQYVNVATSKIL
ncbi:hypothetical protein PPERSA_04165 [Pseudocohnilembus persalinus]|uniref:Uncharacterized protein n=1 Tax=Pseudocohnilembus persalinus TaxID=266149 RepID=A0A0V0QN06_PSEPJ|nr:hypothetical protein PPERSA_04165 [Pseudocohnilembus persalinus]|eukprot:KRX03613.1 hypothetical protein PPERSA_04165 [Pseudocohnilembus persalinus]